MQVRVIALDCTAHILKSQQSHAVATADQRFLATLQAVLKVCISEAAQSACALSIAGFAGFAAARLTGCRHSCGVTKGFTKSSLSTTTAAQ